MKHAFSAIALSLATLASGAAYAGEYIGSVSTNGWYDFRLNPGDRIISPNLRYMTLMQLNGNLVTYRLSDFQMIFNTGPQSNGGTYGQLTEDHGLAIRNNYQELWSTGTAQAGVADPATSLRLHDDGKLEIIGSPIPGSTYPYAIRWRSGRDNYVPSCATGAPVPYQVCIYGGTMTVNMCSPEAANTFVINNGGRYGAC
ncbi:hypothetical protein HF313_15605 [Massilia atriviolacea]|uniref:Bulb-type lectin domain-containing protein n=1 Tax=Massilia atriviolacea TaxID=2495579 RepID=A0A430HC33_9BURK|nr:hypothetical protein [Massilia atriviolacea]RSZ55088.1 hypothetical protein EJB06_31275 [Massilia atriviolacea]